MSSAYVDAVNAGLRQILWADEVERLCLEESNGDIDAALSAADLILGACPFPSETEIDLPGDTSGPDEDWREEAEQVGTSDGKPVDLNKFFAYDIYNRTAQGILNRSILGARKLGAAAKKGLAEALRQDGKGQ